MFITIEGSIGSGKTTLLSRLAQTQPRLHIILEPVGQWINSGWLQRYYSNPKVYGFDFQKYVISSVYDRIKNIQEDDETLYITERSISSSLIFSSVMFQQGILNVEQFEYLKRLVKAMDKSADTIYLKTDYKECKRRIDKRERGAGEDSISLEYLRLLENEHDVRLFSNSIIIDGNNNEDHIYEEALRAIDKITSAKNRRK